MTASDSGETLLYAPHVFYCLADEGCPAGETCCGAKGAMHLFEHMRAYAKSRGVKGIRINRSACLQRCSLGPVMVLYPEGIWYGFRTEADVEEIVDTHILGGERVERLILTPETRPGDLAMAGA